MKKIIICLWFVVVVHYHALLPLVYAQNETLTLLTYYPAPYGVYQKLDIQSASWDKIDIVTTGSAYEMRIGSDNNAMNITANARWNGSAWTRDSTGNPSLAYLQHISNSQHEFRVTQADSGNISWTTAMVIESDSQVGIGTTNPDTKIHIVDAGISSAGGTNIIQRLETNIDFGADVGPSLDFVGRDSGGTRRVFANIKGASTGSGQEGYLAFFTRPSSGNLQERVRIDDRGNVGIKTQPDSNKALYVINSSTSGGSAVEGYGYFGIMGRANSSSSIGVFGKAYNTEPANGYSLPANSGNTGVFGAARQVDGKGVYGHSTGSTGIGVYGRSTNGQGVFGISDGSYAGVWGECVDGVGVWGISTTAAGVSGGSTSGPAVYGVSTSGVGVHGWSTTSNGVYGRGGGAGDYDFYAHPGGAADFGPFTGAHDVKIGTSTTDIRPCMIVIANGEIKKKEDLVSSALPTVELASKTNDNRVFGVFVSEQNLSKDYWFTPEEGERFAIVNAVGEGLVWVTDVNGPIRNGDYITTSNISGYGQKQDDNILHSYTLGKVIQEVDWDTINETIEYNGRKYKKYLIAVTYHCG